MNIELSDKEFRRLLDLVYVGNWVLNSARGSDRFEDYDDLQEKMFALCAQNGMKELYTTWYGHTFPSRAYEEGGIHEAIADYEDAVFLRHPGRGAGAAGYAPGGHGPRGHDGALRTGWTNTSASSRPTG